MCLDQQKHKIYEMNEQVRERAVTRYNRPPSALWCNESISAYECVLASERERERERERESICMCRDLDACSM
jgi:hypothetical protein